MAGRPLRLDGIEARQGGVLDYKLKEMSNSEISDGIIYLILESFANNRDGNETGNLTLNEITNRRQNTFVGTYTDTTRSFNVGTRGLFSPYSITTTNVTVYQVTNTITETGLIRPLCYRNGGIHPMTDQEIFNTIISPALDELTTYGLGSYFLTRNLWGTAPVVLGSSEGLLAGTWKEQFRFIDNYKTGTIPNTSATASTRGSQAYTRFFTQSASNTNNTFDFIMYRKISETAPSSRRRPLRYANTSQRGKHIVEMTDDEIRGWVVRFRNQIVDTQRGIYRLTPNMPTGGTWGSRTEAGGATDFLNTVVTGYFASVRVTIDNSVEASTYTRESVRYTDVPKPKTSGRFYSGDSARYFTGFYTSVRIRYYTDTIYKNVIRYYASVQIFNSTNPTISGNVLNENTWFLWVKASN